MALGKVASCTYSKGVIDPTAVRINMTILPHTSWKGLPADWLNFLINNSWGSQISVKGIEDFLVISIYETDEWITVMKQITTDWLPALGVILQYIIFCNLCVCVTPGSCTLLKMTLYCVQSNQIQRKCLKCEGFVWVTLHNDHSMTWVTADRPLAKGMQPPELTLNPTMCAFKMSDSCQYCDLQTPCLTTRRKACQYRKLIYF